MPIIIAIMIVANLFFLFMLFRNDWLLEKRLDLIHKDVEAFKAYYWSYDKMLWHFWIWNVEKMKRHI